MKKVFVTLMFINLILFVYSQNKIAKIPILKKQEVREVFDLKENGIIVKVAKPDNLITLHYYTPKLDFVWSTDITKIQYGDFDNPIIVSPSGNNVVYVELTGYLRSFGVLQLYMTFISRDGKSRLLHLDGIKEIGDIKSIFCTDTYLFIYMVFKGDDQVFQSKLMRIKIDDLTKEIFPMGKVGDVFLGYVGHNETNFYISEKTVNLIEEKVTYKINKYNLEGKLVNSIILQPELKTNNISASNNIKEIPGVFSGNIYLDVVQGVRSGGKIPVQKLQILTKQTDFYQINTSGSSSETYYINNAYGNIKADLKNGFIYCYGLYSGKNKLDYEGFYLNKYDLNGKLLSSINSADSPLSNNSEITKRKAKAYNRFVAFMNTPNNTVTLFLWETGMIFGFEYNISDMKLLNAYKTATPGIKGNYEYVKMCLDPNIKLKSKSYLENERKNKVDQVFHIFQYNESNKSSVIVRNIKANKQFNCELLYFNEGSK